MDRKNEKKVHCTHFEEDTRNEAFYKGLFVLFFRHMYIILYKKCIPWMRARGVDGGTNTPWNSSRRRFAVQKKCFWILAINFGVFSLEDFLVQSGDY